MLFRLLSVAHPPQRLGFNLSIKDQGSGIRDRGARDEGGGKDKQKEARCRLGVY
jgi:hypothetical protein